MQHCEPFPSFRKNYRMRPKRIVTGNSPGFGTLEPRRIKKQMQNVPEQVPWFDQILFNGTNTDSH